MADDGIDMVILDINMGYGLIIWEMTIKIWSAWISIWDILSPCLLPWSAARRYHTAAATRGMDTTRSVTE